MKDSFEKLDLSSKDVDYLLALRGKIDEEIEKRISRNVTILFTDIVDSTGYFKRFGNVAGRAMLINHREMMRPIVESHQGRLLKSTGDSLMIQFFEPLPAVSCAIDMQRALRSYNRPKPESKRVRVRIGINHGPGLFDRGDYYGETVNMAAKIMSISNPDEIYISNSVAEIVKSEAGSSFRIEPVPHQKYKVYRVIWKDDELSPGVRRTGFTREDREAKLPGVIEEKIEKWLKEADIYFSQGILPEAQKIYEKVLDLDPDNHEARKKLAEIEEHYRREVPQAKVKEALQKSGLMDNWDRIIFDNELANDESKTEKGSIRFRLGLVHKELGLFDLAVKDFEKALQQGYEKTETYKELGHCYLNMGMINNAKHNFDLALKLAKKEGHSSHIRSLREIAELYREKGLEKEMAEMSLAIARAEKDYTSIMELIGKVGDSKASGHYLSALILDTPDTRSTSFRKKLELAGFKHLHYVSDIDEVRSYVGKDPSVDIIFMDFTQHGQHAGIKSLETATALRKATGIPVLIMVSKDKLPDIPASDEEKKDLLLTKPISIEGLQEKILHNFLKSRRRE